MDSRFSKLSHIDPDIAARAAAAPGPAARAEIAFDPGFVAHPRANQILHTLAELIHRPEAAPATEVMVLAGPRSAGKTAILAHFRRKLQEGKLGDRLLLARVPVPADPGSISLEVLRALGMSCAPEAAAQTLRATAAAASPRPRVLAFDAAENVLAAPSDSRESAVAAMCECAHLLGANLVLAATPEAMPALRASVALAGRLIEEPLPAMRPDHVFNQFVIAAGRRMPLLKASRFSDPNLARKIHALAEGLPGAALAIMARATAAAIRAGTEVVDFALLDNIGWVPSARRASRTDNILQGKAPLPGMPPKQAPAKPAAQQKPPAKQAPAKPAAQQKPPAKQAPAKPAAQEKAAASPPASAAK